MRVGVGLQVEMEVMQFDGINRDCQWSTDVGVQRIKQMTSTISQPVGGKWLC